MKNLDSEIKFMVQDLKIELNTISGNTIMITGATGLIGSLLLSLFTTYNDSSINKIKMVLPLRNKSKLNSMFTQEQHKFMNIIDIEDISTPFIYDGEIDYIVHTACPTSSKHFINHPIQTIESIVLGTRNILRLAEDKNVKSMVYLSSMEVYGQVQAKQNPITEDKLGFIKLNDVRSSYSEGKRLAELLCFSFYMQKKCNVKIARLAQTFGVGVNHEDNRVFMQFAKSALNEDNIELHTYGKSIGNYVATTDAIQALIYILLKGEPGESYNINNEKISMKVYDMARFVSEKFTNNKSDVVIKVPNKITGYAPTTKMLLSSKKTKQLGWMPKKDLDIMYQEVFDSIKAFAVKGHNNEY